MPASGESGKTAFSECREARARSGSSGTRAETMRTHSPIMHRLLQPSSEHEKFKLHPKALESMKIQLSGLCPLGPLRASWAGPSSPPLRLMHPAQYTLFSVSKHQCGRGSRLWSGHQSYKVPPLSSWLFCSLFHSCSCYYPAFINNMALLLSLLTYVQPSPCAQFSSLAISRGLLLSRLDPD